MALNEASSLINRFSTINNGYIITIGNSLLLGTTNQTEFSGPFITTDTTQQVVGYSVGTTLNWQNNSSTAILSLLSGSTVLFAELSWYSTVKYSSIDLTNIELTPVTLSTPSGNFTITPQNSQRENSESSSGIIKTFRSADVTSLVSSGGSGVYTLGGVPSLNGTQLNVSKCGWSINIVVVNSSLPFRILSVYSGALFNTNPNSISQTLTNFSTPSTGSINGRINLVVAGGDPNYYDTASAGSSQSSLIALGNTVITPTSNPGTSPNNPSNNIFWGGINIADALDSNVGKLDTRGSFGSFNHDGFIQVFNNPARNKWDITSLDLSQALTNSQNQLMVKVIASGVGESYEVIGMTFQVDSVGVDLLAQKIVDKASAFVGEDLTYTINVSNTGQIDLDNVIVTDILQSDLSFNLGSVTINGIPSLSSNPSSISLGTISKGQTIILSYTAAIVSMPSSKQITNDYNVQYSYSLSIGNTINDSSQSNTVTTNVLNVILTKVVDKAYVSLGDTLTYTIGIQNIGNYLINNLIFQDSIPSGTSFILNSLTIDSAAQNGISPTSQININSLAGGATTTFSWKALVNNSLPSINPIPNTATIILSNGLIKTSNTVNTSVYQPDLLGSSNSNFIKSSDKLFADLGEIITYNFSIRNTGNTAANNVILKDLLQTEISFNPGTVAVNGSIVANFDPIIGIDLGTINVNQTVTVFFKGTVNQVPISGNIQSTGTLNYTYTLDPSQINGKSNNITSNNLIITIKHGEILQNNAIKSINSVQVTSSDIITYTVSAKNTGNTDLLNVSITDVMPIGATFLPGTVMINGILSSADDPNTGVNIGNIASGTTSILRFNTKIDQNAPQTLTNTANINYSYFVDPNKALINKSILTNGVSVYNLNNNLNLLVSSNRIGAVAGDTISYTIVAKNIGDVNLNNVTINYELPNNVKFIGNLIVDGIASSSDITIGVNVGNITVNNSITITFDIKVAVILDTSRVVSYAIAKYIYSPNQQTLFNGQNQSIQNIVTLYNPSIVLSKSSNRNIAKIGDSIIYTIKVYNDGDINIANGVLIDKLPSQLSINSIEVDGVLNTGDIYTGLSIGKIIRGQTIIITLNISVVALLNGTDTFTNKVIGNFSIITDPNFPLTSLSKIALDLNQIRIVKEYISLTKKIYNGYQVSDNVISYILIITNNLKFVYENSSLYNVIVSDLLSSNLKFIQGSIKIDNLSYPNYNILSGINLGTLRAKESRTIMFSANILLTGSDVINNFAILEYKFIMNTDLPMQTDVISSNIINSEIISTDLLITKVANKTQASVGDQISYTVTIQNTSNLNIIKAVFKDYTSNSVSLVDETFKIDNTLVNSVLLTKGIVIGPILENSTVVITYTVVVNKVDSTGQIQNTTNISYIYKLDDGTTGVSNKNSNTITIPLV